MNELAQSDSSNGELNLEGSCLDPEAALAALGNRQRWKIVRILADGKALTAGAVASEFGRNFDTMSKHLRILRKAGVLASRSGVDRRQELFFIPSAFRREPDELDLGFCLFRLPGARPDPINSIPHEAGTLDSLRRRMEEMVSKSNGLPTQNRLAFGSTQQGMIANPTLLNQPQA